jgi:hypothetical protein
MYGKLFGQYLYDKGVISTSQLKDALIRQDRTGQAIGILSLEQQILTKDQVLTILAKQRRSTKYFGEIAIELGYLNQNQVTHLLDLQRTAHLHLSDILITEGYIDIADLATHSAHFHQENKEIEYAIREQLVTTGHAPLYEIILSTFQSYFSRAICGRAKALSAHSLPETFNKDIFVSALMTRNIVSPAAQLSFGFSLDRRTAFSLCYCLSNRVMHSWERICGVLKEYCQSLGYLVDNQLRNAGHAPSQGDINFFSKVPLLHGTPLFLSFTSTIGPFPVFLNITNLS